MGWHPSIDGRLWQIDKNGMASAVKEQTGAGKYPRHVRGFQRPQFGWAMGGGRFTLREWQIHEHGRRDRGLPKARHPWLCGGFSGADLGLTNEQRCFFFGLEGDRFVEVLDEQKAQHSQKLFCLKARLPMGRFGWAAGGRGLLRLAERATLASRRCNTGASPASSVTGHRRGTSREISGSGPIAASSAQWS